MGSGSRFFSKGNVFVPGKSDRCSGQATGRWDRGGWTRISRNWPIVRVARTHSSSEHFMQIHLASRKPREFGIEARRASERANERAGQQAGLHGFEGRMGSRAEISFQPASEMGGVTYAIYKLFSHLVPTPPRRHHHQRRPWSRLVGVEYIIPVQPGPILSSSEPKATFSALRFHARVLLAFQGWKMGDKLESGWYCQ
ncbi:LOW QUALITY PROTEIN: hypothetical protein V1477_011982 [Vespula maculifrons]|uniref:Uncharacterized protein n=1 Tax=Vespula maculifrons TaxID=7453 RepID=A0ABD2C0S2_VESMC